MSNIRFALDLFFHELNHDQINSSPTDENYNDMSFQATKNNMDNFFSSIPIQDLKKKRGRGRPRSTFFQQLNSKTSKLNSNAVQNLTEFCSSQPCAVNSKKSEPLNPALQINAPIERNVLWLQKSDELLQPKKKRGRPRSTFFQSVNSVSTSEPNSKDKTSEITHRK